MKFRLTVLIVFLSLVLASCSLSEDITPPPGYQSPKSAPTQGSATSTQPITLTMEPATAYPEASSTVTLSTTAESSAIITPIATPPGGTATTTATLGNISGKLVNGSGSSIPNGQKVTLEGFDQDKAGSYNKSMQLEASVNPDGSYDFAGVEFPLNRAFLVITSWQGVEYPSDPVYVKDATTNYSIPITIYDKSDDLTGLKTDQVHLSFVLSSQSVMQVTEIFIVTNPGKRAIVVSSDGTTIPFIQLPANASSAQYQLSQNSAQLMNATNGFALLPGTDKQYGFVASFNMPYGKNLNFNQAFSLPVSSLAVFLPQGMRLIGKNLTSAGTQDVQGQTFLMYQENNIASGNSITFTLSGVPATSTGTSSVNKTWVWIGIGSVGILLIVLGILLYWRDRNRFKKEQVKQSEGKIEEDALGEDSDIIIDALIALDDEYKAGEIPKEAYEKRRLELKERLKGLL